jgi:hypothetical protein
VTIYNQMWAVIDPGEPRTYEDFPNYGFPEGELLEIFSNEGIAWAYANEINSTRCDGWGDTWGYSYCIVTNVFDRAPIGSNVKYSDRYAWPENESKYQPAPKTFSEWEPFDIAPDMFVCWEHGWDAVSGRDECLIGVFRGTDDRSICKRLETIYGGKWSAIGTWSDGDVCKFKRIA